MADRPLDDGIVSAEGDLSHAVAANRPMSATGATGMTNLRAVMRPPSSFLIGCPAGPAKAIVLPPIADSLGRAFFFGVTELPLVAGRSAAVPCAMACKLSPPSSKSYAHARSFLPIYYVEYADEFTRKFA